MKSIDVVDPASVNRRYSIMANVLRASSVAKAVRDSVEMSGGDLTYRVAIRTTAPAAAV
jgi:hypothetical protein